MALKWIMKQHDTLPSLELTLLDGTTPVDLSAADSALFLMRNFGGLKVNSAMTFVDRVHGKVRYDWVTGDTDTASDYDAEVQITWADLRIQTFPADQYITVSVEADLGP